MTATKRKSAVKKTSKPPARYNYTDPTTPLPIGPLGRCWWDESAGRWQIGLNEEGQKFVADWLAKWGTTQRLMHAPRSGLRAMYNHAVGLGHTEEEIESAGLEGLVKAAIWWDPARAEFSTTLVWRLREQLGKLVNVRASKGHNAVHVSLSNTHQRDNPETIAGSLSDPTPPPEPSDSMEPIVKALQRLPQRERLVVQLRVLGGRGLEDIGEHFGISKERVRQLERTALYKLSQILGERYGYAPRPSPKAKSPGASRRTQRKAHAHAC